MFIINPGTEEQTNYNVSNAEKIADFICEDLGVKEKLWVREPKEDDGKGWFGFLFSGKGGKVSVQIPGIDPDTVRKGEPWKSPRLYVDGSSWLYGYALGSIEEAITAKGI